MSRVFNIAKTAVHELEPATAVATVAAAEALRRVVGAQAQLDSHRTEASLKQLVAVVRDTAPELQQACWLLVSQHDVFKTQAS